MAVRASAAAAFDAESDAAALEHASRPPSPPRPAFGVDAAREQQHIVASGVARSHRDDAIAYLVQHQRRFPLIAKAMRARGGGGLQASLGDFSVVVLIPAVLAAKQQVHGFAMLKLAAQRANTAAGEHSVAAALAFGDTLFDYDSARAIRDEGVGMEVSVVDLCLGVLPVTQLALRAFFAHHAYRPPETSELERLATDVKF